MANYDIERNEHGTFITVSSYPQFPIRVPDARAEDILDDLNNRRSCVGEIHRNFKVVGCGIQNYAGVKPKFRISGVWGQ